MKKSRSKGLMIGVDALYLMLKLLAENQGKPLKFPLAWQKDEMRVFFNRCVKDGFAVWGDKERGSWISRLLKSL